MSPTARVLRWLGAGQHFGGNALEPPEPTEIGLRPPADEVQLEWSLAPLRMLPSLMGEHQVQGKGAVQQVNSPSIEG